MLQVLMSDEKMVIHHQARKNMAFVLPCMSTLTVFSLHPIRLDAHPLPIKCLLSRVRDSLSKYPMQIDNMSNVIDSPYFPPLQDFL